MQQRYSNRLVQCCLLGLLLAATAPAVGCVDSDEPEVSADTDQLPAAPGGAGLYLVVDRPPTVPAGYIGTPNGWFDPACVATVRDDERVTIEGHVQRRDGSLQRATQPCSSPRFDMQGQMIAPRGSADDGVSLAAPPASNGWIASTQSRSTGPLSFVHTQWTVPAAPTRNTGQIIYFFPGLEDASRGVTILQPVLGWNQSEGPSGWSLASWHCCANGQTWHSSFLPVAAGSTVSGDMTGTNCSASGLCTNWAIDSISASGQRVTLNTTTNETMDWLFGAVLEAYSIDRCNELPGTGQSVTSAFSLRAAPGGAAVAIPAWTNDTPAQTPACGYAVSSTATTTTLRWRNTP